MSHAGNVMRVRFLGAAYVATVLGSGPAHAQNPVQISSLTDIVYRITNTANPTESVNKPFIQVNPGYKGDNFVTLFGYPTGSAIDAPSGGLYIKVLPADVIAQVRKTKADTNNDGSLSTEELNYLLIATLGERDTTYENVQVQVTVDGKVINQGIELEGYEGIALARILEKYNWDNKGSPLATLLETIEQANISEGGEGGAGKDGGTGGEGKSGGAQTGGTR